MIILLNIVNLKCLDLWLVLDLKSDNKFWDKSCNLFATTRQCNFAINNLELMLELPIARAVTSQNFKTTIGFNSQIHLLISKFTQGWCVEIKLA